MSNLVSDNQGRETARLARSVGLPRDIYQEALTDGTVKRFLHELLPKSVEYPDWVRDHLTPELEATTVCDPGKVELWLDPRQSASPYPTGNEVYEALKNNGLLERSLSLGHLKWFEENPDTIPAEFRGKWIYGWASAVRHADGVLYVPCLLCVVAQPFVHWLWLDNRWCGFEPAGLRAS